MKDIIFVRCNIYLADMLDCLYLYVCGVNMHPWTLVDQRKIIHVDNWFGRNLIVDKCYLECLIWTFTCYYLLLDSIGTSDAEITLMELLLATTQTDGFVFAYNYSVLINL